MKKIHLLAGIVLLMGLSSCLSTVHPIFTERDLVFDQRLFGKWRHESKSVGGFVEITKAKPEDFSRNQSLQKLADKTYMIRYLSDKGDISQAYFGYLVKLNGRLYMDFFPAETPTQSKYDDFFKEHFINMHTCFSIRFTKDNAFELKQFDENYLQQLVANKKIRITHESTEDGSIVVTAPTEELQQYIIKYSEVPEAYYQDNTSTYTRIAHN